MPLIEDYQGINKSLMSQFMNKFGTELVPTRFREMTNDDVLHVTQDAGKDQDADWEYGQRKFDRKGWRNHGENWREIEREHKAIYYVSFPHHASENLVQKSYQLHPLIPRILPTPRGTWVIRLFFPLR